MEPLYPFILAVTVASTGSLYIQFASPVRNRIFLRRLLAALCLGAPPLFMSWIQSDASQLGIAWSNSGLTVSIALSFSAAAIVLNYFVAGRPENMRVYPQLRAAVWTPRLLSANGLSWIAYLFGYELLLRGFVFLSLLDYLSTPWAIAVTTLFYAVLHLPKGARETWLSIPFGVLLCILTLNTGNIWCAVIIHVSLALSNEYFALRSNPEMTIRLISIQH